MGEIVLAGKRKLIDAIGIDEAHFILIRLKADAGLGNIVGDDQFALLVREFFACVGARS